MAPLTRHNSTENASYQVQRIPHIKYRECLISASYQCNKFHETVKGQTVSRRNQKENQKSKRCHRIGGLYCAGVVFVQITFPCFQLSSDVLSTLPNVKSVTHSSITISTATFDFPSFQATTRMQKNSLLCLRNGWLEGISQGLPACKVEGWM